MKKASLVEAGAYPEKANKSMARRKNKGAFREYIDRCAMSKLEKQEPPSTRGTNPLDNILNENATIEEGRLVKTQKN